MTLSPIPTRAVSLIQADAWFDEITVFTASQGDITKLIGQRLGLLKGANAGAKRGLLVVCGIHGGVAPDPSSRKRFVSPRLGVAVMENPMVNNTTGPKQALDAVEMVIDSLWLKSAIAGVSDQNAVVRFVPVADPLFEVMTPEVMASLYGVQGVIGYHVWFEVTAHV